MRWTPRRRRPTPGAATQDSTAIAYLGDFESGATRASLPVTNSARMLQVSPASAAATSSSRPRVTTSVPERSPAARAPSAG